MNDNNNRSAITTVNVSIYRRSSFVKALSLPGIIFFSLLLLLFSETLAAQEVPHEIGGFILGSNVTDYPDIEYSNFLKEVVIYNWHGFDKGIISYGICEFPGEIVKIKLKYNDSSKKFFKTLLKKYKKKFGEPTEWKGDSFGILHIWKWKFTDKNNNKVHLILQHNTRNANENIGNMVKLYYPERIELEQLCFTKKCKTGEDKTEMMQRMMPQKNDWDYLIPK